MCSNAWCSEKWSPGAFPSKSAREAPSAYKSVRKKPRGAISHQVAREAPPAYKSIRKVASGGHFPANRPGGPASVQIYTKRSLWGPFPSKSPREAPPAYKSIRKVAPGGYFRASRPGKSRQCTNRYESGLLKAAAPLAGSLLRLPLLRARPHLLREDPRWRLLRRQALRPPPRRVGARWLLRPSRQQAHDRM